MFNTTKAEATADGKKLVEKLGPKFEYRVWDNLGWHFAAYFKGETEIHVHQYGDRYTVMLNVNPQIVLHGDDPVDLVMIAVARLNNHIADLQRSADELKGCV